MTRVVVIGAGIGGLTTAAVLARRGLDVSVLEAHVYPGGCAGTFYHQGYRFDAGATLAGGFYPGGPMDLVAQEAGIAAWPSHPVKATMVVHLPDLSQVTRWSDERGRDEYRRVFGDQYDSFWDWQEQSADALWNLALRSPDWPPQTPQQLLSLLRKAAAWLGHFPTMHRVPDLFLDAFRPLASHLAGASESLRLFVDAQLLISAQSTSRQANALYGASALDLPRRGVVHLEGGMGAIADTLVQAVRSQGGRVAFRQKVSSIELHPERQWVIETKRGDRHVADLIVANLPPWNLRDIIRSPLPAKLSNLPQFPADGWGAFTVYIGVDRQVVPDDLPLHHQVILKEPMGEGNTVFLSLSPSWDHGRAPEGKRALTISTHTRLPDWWRLYETDRPAYQARKDEYLNRILSAASRVIPNLQAGSDLILPGTPVTFERFTHRHLGWVGGFPQVNLFRAWGPRLAPGLWMVGDSIFPGQSTAAAALGGLRVARDVLLNLGLSIYQPAQPLASAA